MSSGRYHEGELAMQERAGVRTLAERVGRIIGPELPAVAAAFLAAQRFVLTSTVSATGAVTASLIGGEVGFAYAVDPTTLELSPTLGHIDDVRSDVEATAMIGLLAIDFATRRRMRVNGQAHREGERIFVTTSEVYSNCPQYIHPRRPMLHSGSQPAAMTGKSLDERQRRLIAESDTFFIASMHPERGADISHRGGDPGFVTASPTHLRWPDYPGNNMFNTLGNLLIDPRCGLLFVDFERGSTLQIRGTATVRGDETRTIEIEIDEVVTTEALFA